MSVKFHEKETDMIDIMTDPQDYERILSQWYFQKTGKVLNLKNPGTFNEKIQWLKLYDNSELKTRLSDKYEVRDWVKEKIGEEYLIPLLGVWNHTEDIEWQKLPEKFVLKATHGSGWNILVNKKSQMDRTAVDQKLNDWLNMNWAFLAGLELQYKNIVPRIIAEEYLENENQERAFGYLRSTMKF